MKEMIVSDDKGKRVIAIVEDSKLIEKYDEDECTDILEGNVYIGKITDVLLGMQAAFVDIGDERNAFLHIKDILPKVSDETGNKNEDLSKYNIKNYVKVGMPVVVEVKKDKTDKKGARVSTNLNLGGEFAALIPNSNFITVSQKIEDVNKINELKEIVSKMLIKDYGVILRTSAENATKKQIEDDIKSVIQLHKKIIEKSNKIISNEKNFKPTLLFHKGDLISRLLLDIGNQDLKKIFVNNSETYERVKQEVEERKLDIQIELKEGNILELYSVESQIDKMTNRKIWLKCGGFITIDKTEALTAIDVNSGKFVGKESIEDTVLKVNLEATEEIANQIRVRDIGGIIVVDYIDMSKKEDEEAVKTLLLECLKKDRAKTQVIGFTKLHLLEMTRKRIC